MTILGITWWVLIVVVSLLILKLVFEVFYTFPCGYTVREVKLMIRDKTYFRNSYPYWVPFSKFVKVREHGIYYYNLKTGNTKFIHWQSGDKEQEGRSNTESN